MRVRELDIVVLTRDVPEHGLKAGDLGTVVFLYEPKGLEVEFVTAAGQTIAVATLGDEDVRRPDGDDTPSMRRLPASPLH